MSSKTFSVFSSLNFSERNELTSFIRLSNPSNSNKLLKLTKAFSDLTKHNLPFNKNQVIKNVFGHNEKKLDVNFRLLQSDLQRYLEKYIIWKKLEEQESMQNEILLDFYKSKSLHDVHHKSLNSYSKKLTNKNLLDVSVYDDKVKLAELRYEKVIQERKQGMEETQTFLELTDKAYMVKKLKLICLVTSQETVYNIKFDHGLKNEMLSFIRKKKLYKDPLIGVFYYCYQMLNDKSEKSFEYFYDFLNQNNHLFSREENTQLYTLAINYCIRALNQGQKHYGIRGISLYESSLDKGVMLNNGKISRFTFRNIVTMALRVQEYERAQEFINKYSDLLEKSEQKNMKHFTMALVLFYQGDFDNAGEELLNARFKDLLFNLATKGLQLKIYYELGEMYVLLSHLDAMQIWLKRHTKLGYHKQNYSNIIAFTRKLVKAKSLDQLIKLESAIRSEPNLTDRKWLLDKLKEKM